MVYFGPQRALPSLPRDVRLPQELLHCAGDLKKLPRNAVQMYSRFVDQRPVRPLFVDLTEKLEVCVDKLSTSLHHDQDSRVFRSEMQQLREMVSYQTGLITGLHTTCSSLVTTVTTLYETNFKKNS